MHKINLEIASVLNAKAEKLEEQNKDVYRVIAYRKAARAISIHEEALDEMYRRSWIKGIQKIPGVGNRLARTIENELKKMNIKKS